MESDQESAIGEGLLGKDTEQCPGQRDRLAARCEGVLDRDVSFYGGCRFRGCCRQD
jgi:hypothetical protein